ncbi:MAG: hypothetical protein CMN58_06135 [Solibacterales bacterium]|uniref:Uncharacterized protein n=1 Tax=Candidatus Moanibacter tarae TaxID=2200854 RepID=A0A2Z4AFM8_9BACT|nr:MAG: hypothetical protein DF168_01541 [Candidatus Moanabacter tarae]MBG99906.1 hypothetical protein [Bryobacterales bacterium]|tara:strand:+ start:4731 stop:5570 length:840 start_codon:yes stop_codon:yes gene_type:complete
MTFKKTPSPPLLQGSLGPATVTVLGANGLRLTGLKSFHLDEGPDYAWLNIYRTLADRQQLEITRDRDPSNFGVSGNAVEVRWAPNDRIRGSLWARYEIVDEEDAIDVTFGADLQAAYGDFELFIANYFTPYHVPRFAISDNRTHPEGNIWYEKQWNGEGENESWARDEQAEKIFRDGRWLTGHSLNWRRGPFYTHPIMIQEHRYGGHAIVLMARRQDCFGISGYNSYHNSQYLHLWGRDVAAGEQVSVTVRLLLITEWEDLQREAMIRYEKWLENFCPD